MKYYIHNELSNNGIKPKIEGVELIRAVGLDYKKFFKELKSEDEVVFLGGDGTVNYLINEIDGMNVKNNIYLLANGSGNDFLNDI